MDNKKQVGKLGIRVLLFPLPFQGHMRPMLHLGNALYSKGFSITIIQTRFNSPDPTKFPNFTFHFIDDGLQMSPAVGFQALSPIKASCLEPFRHCLSQILSNNSSSEHNEPVACLIADPSWEFAGAVADSFHLPRIALKTGSILTYYVYDSLLLLREKGYFPLQESRLEESVLELPPLRVKDLPSEAHHDLLAAMVKESKTYSQGIICNAFEELEPSVLARTHQDHHPIPIFLLGPLHKFSSSSATNSLTKDQSCISWLNTQAPKSVLYVCFGSVAAISEEQFLEIAWGLANCTQPFLWVVRPGLIHRSEIDDPFPEGFLEIVGSRGHIVEWAPQVEVLAHPAVGGFWTHCGWNSTVESICEGVPMICQPFFMDQRMNARHISDVWKIGLLLEKELQRDVIEKTIRTLMVEKDGKEMRDRAAALAKKGNLCLVEGGSSSESLNMLTTHILTFHNSQRTSS